MYVCQECGRKFRTTRAAEKAALEGCPNCGGVDIDLDVKPEEPSHDMGGDDALDVYHHGLPKDDTYQ